MVEPLALIDSDFRQNDSEVVVKCDKNKVKPSLEFLNSQGLIKKFLSLPRREYLVKSSYTCTKAGFTLAEVLITLGIIGVVAAMTIPNLMTKMQWIQLHSQFRHAYSTVFNALRLMSNEEEDGVPICYYSRGMYNSSTNTECPKFYDLLAKKIKTMTICKGDAYEKGCIPKYKGQNELYSFDGSEQFDSEDYFNRNCSGFSSNSILKRSVTYTFIDGTILITYGSSSSSAPLFLLDINGQKGPNKWGWDLFAFIIQESVSGDLYISPFDGGCSAKIEKGGKTAKQMMQQSR